MEVKKVEIIVDEKKYKADPSTNYLDACLSLGFDLPYFCWHPAMGSVGACRQCAIKSFKDEKDEKGKLVMACMEPVKDGGRISINDAEAKEMRSNVIQWLMTNHPHDCPVCDEGGECHLQDMTVMTGHTYRNFEFNKRTYRNQYLGPFINHEMNRCIQCYRCVRFYRDYADGKDFDSMAAHNHVYFGRSEDGVLENEFSGNLIEVCPTGVFTDKTLKEHYTRKWDFTAAPSICVNCALGCNIIAGERYGELRRIRSRFNSEVNGYFICDRGRFGYEHVNSDNRIRKPLLKGKGQDSNQVSESEILNKIGKIISESRGVIGIGSPRASIESNFVLKKLVGEENFYNGISNEESKLISLGIDILSKGRVYSPSMHQVEESDAVFILGEDLTNTAPMMALAVRQSVKQISKKIAEDLKIPLWNDAAVREAAQYEKGPLFIAETHSSKLDEVASQTYYADPAGIAKFGFAIANLINNNSPFKDNLSEDEKNAAKNIVDKLLSSNNPIIICGTSIRSEAVIKAAANIAYALSSEGKKAGFSFIPSESNSIGSVMFEKDGLNLIDDKNKEAETLIILKNDLYRRGEKKNVDDFLNRFKNIITLDSFNNQTTEKANFIVPVGTFAESDGTIVNNECRAQRYYQVYVPKDSEIKESWRWLKNIATASGKKDFENFNSFYDFTKAAADSVSVFKGIDTIAPPPGFRIAGQKIPRETHRFSGRTAKDANIDVSEPKPPNDPDSALTYTMEGYQGEPPSSIIPFFWSPGWNSVQSINKYQIEVDGPLQGGDPGRRLIEPEKEKTPEYFDSISETSEQKNGEYLFVPVYHIYGSEELSSMSPAIKERIPEPYVLLNEKDIKEKNLNEGDKLKVTIGELEINLKVKVDKKIPHGLAGFPSGLSEIPFVKLPAHGEIEGGNQ